MFFWLLNHRYSQVNRFKVGSIALAGLLVCAGCTSNDYRYRNIEPNKSRSYAVRPGDTLYGIAKQAKIDYRRLAAWNNIKYPYTIKPNQIILLFDPKIYSSTRTKKARTSSKSSYRPPRSKKNKKKSYKKLKVLWQWPIRGVIAKNFSQTGRKGLDIVGKYGEPVRAAAGGKIVYSGQGLIGYGNLVIVKHSENFLSAYANNKRLLVREGETVKLGQQIAEVGKNAAKRASLHFEIRKDGKPVNPILYLPNP